MIWSARIWPSPCPIFVHQSFVSVFRCSSLSSSASSTVLCGCKNIWGSKSQSNRIVSLPELRDNAMCPVIPSTLATPKRKRISHKDPLTPNLSSTKKVRGCTVARESMGCFRKSKSVLNFSCSLFDYIPFFLPSTRCFSHIAHNSLKPIELCGWFVADCSGCTEPEDEISNTTLLRVLVLPCYWLPATFRRWMTARGNDLLLSFVKPCWKIFISFQVSITISSCFMGASSNTLNWRYGIPSSRTIPSSGPQGYPNLYLKLVCVAVDAEIDR